MNNKFFAGLCLAYLLCMPSPALGQTAEFELEPVVVTATRIDRSVKEVSVATQIINSEDIEKTGAVSLAQVMESAAGVQITGGTGKKSVVMRGFDSRFVMIMIDGRRLASEPDQSFELERIPLANIERIEIIRGPQSALYGTEALGGVVNIITKNPKEQSLNLSLALGQYAVNGGDRQNYGFNFNSGQVGRMRYSVYAAYRDSPPLYRYQGFTYQPYGWRRDAGLRADYDLSHNETITLNLSYEEESLDEITFRAPAFLRRTHDKNRRVEQSLGYTRKTDNTEIFVRYYQGVLNKAIDQLNDTTGSLVSPDSWVRSERTMRVLEGRLTRTINPKHTLTVGAEYRPEKFRGTAINTGEGLFDFTYNGVTRTGSTARLNYLAVYAQDEWTISPRFKAIFALRYDDNNKFGDDISPKAGFIYNINSRERLKINLAKAFRSPTPNQLYKTTPPPLGNPDLRSEKAVSYDLSWEKETGRSVYKITYFHNSVKDLIESDGDRYQNISKATLQGLEAEYSVRIHPLWALTGNYAWLRAMDDTLGVRLHGRANHLASLQALYEHKKIAASFRAQLYGSYLPTNDASILNKQARSYVTCGLSGSYQLTDKTRLIAGVHNIFNKRDEDTLEPGRYLYVSLNLRF